MVCAGITWPTKSWVEAEASFVADFDSPSQYKRKKRLQAFSGETDDVVKRNGSNSEVNAVKFSISITEPR